MNDIEAFRKQLIDANSSNETDAINKFTSDHQSGLIYADLVVAHQALDRLTKNLEKQLEKERSNDFLIHYAQLRGELYSYLNGLSLLLQDYDDAIETIA